MSLTAPSPASGMKAETTSLFDDREVVGEYFLADTLGTGSYGSVRYGSHRVSASPVAVKVLAKDVSDTSTIRRISTEISSMEKVGRGCPFIVQLHEVLIGEDNIYLVMEYAAGGELFPSLFDQTKIKEWEREARAQHYFQQLVLGLQWCHLQGAPRAAPFTGHMQTSQHSIQRPQPRAAPSSTGVAHRDLKPQNLLVGKNNVLKIADFGLAASFNPDPALRGSTRGLRRTMCGSPLYMAPELLVLKQGAVYCSLSADVWSCGAVLFAMLAGTPPYPATSLPELVQMTSHPRGLRMPDNLSRDLRALIRGMLTVDPTRRLTLNDVRRHPWFSSNLDRALEHTPSFVPPEIDLTQPSRLDMARFGSSRRSSSRQVAGAAFSRRSSSSARRSIASSGRRTLIEPEPRVVPSAQRSSSPSGSPSRCADAASAGLTARASKGGGALVHAGGTAGPETQRRLNHNLRTSSSVPGSAALTTALTSVVGRLRSFLTPHQRTIRVAQAM